ncbi:MAG: tRNA (adenosine(37)-N6)-threonylcarbamoyltransferase complex dimerization subunit type 1 TsaB [Clostridia bacterium]|nr:tRNA (adenosine(37)-N6)-threonylcarbamoyltransferase complex dimerization subunit type 1 TsaB [Clostridia bacterium]
MKILAIDTTAVTATAALCDGEKRLGEFTVCTAMHHSETMLPMIKELLRSCSCTFDEVQLLAGSAGPGSFTGVRIGASILLGLAFEKSIPCIGVSSLQALSYNMSGISGDFIACPVMDARRGQLYNALFRHTSECITRLCEDRIIMADQLAAELAQYTLPVYFIGDGAYIAKAEYEKGLIPPEQLRLQSAYSVAQTALRIYESTSDKTVFEPQFFKPTYLRASQAERERNGLK